MEFLPRKIFILIDYQEHKNDSLPNYILKNQLKQIPLGQTTDKSQIEFYLNLSLTTAPIFLY